MTAVRMANNVNTLCTHYHQRRLVLTDNALLIFFRLTARLEPASLTSIRSDTHMDVRRDAASRSDASE